jgi:hypothetical protein
VFVPSSTGALAEVAAAGRAGDNGSEALPAGGAAHGVTDALRADFPDADDEELEYLAMTAAAQRSVALLDGDGPFARIVLAVDADAVLPVGSEDPTLVRVGRPVPLRDLVSVHVDSEDAADDVRAARAALAAHAEDAEQRLTRCLDHELGWYAASELDEVVRRTTGDRRHP